MASSQQDTDDKRLNQILKEEMEDHDVHIWLCKQLAHCSAELLGSSLKMDRHMIGGAIGKGTSLGSHFDPETSGLYMFLNVPNVSTADETVLKKHLEAALEVIEAKMKEHAPFLEVRYRTEFAVGITHVGSGAKMELIPAINFGKPNQVKQVFLRMSKAGKELPWLNSSVTEASVDFIKRQPPFLRQVVRLARLWNKQNLAVYFNCPCCGNKKMECRATIVELMGVKAAQDEMQEFVEEKDRSLARALKRFMDYMSTDWRKLKISFENQQLPEEMKEMFEKRKKQTRTLIDPVNLFKNYLDHATVKLNWQFVQHAAKSSLDFMKTENRKQYPDIARALISDRCRPDYPFQDTLERRTAEQMDARLKELLAQKQQ